MYKVINFQVEKEIVTTSKERAKEGRVIFTESLQVEINGTSVKRILQSVAIFLEADLKEFSVGNTFDGKIEMVRYEYNNKKITQEEDFQFLNGKIDLTRSQYTFDVIAYEHLSNEELQQALKEVK